MLCGGDYDDDDDDGDGDYDDDDGDDNFHTWTKSRRTLERKLWKLPGIGTAELAM